MKKIIRSLVVAGNVFGCTDPINILLVHIKTEFLLHKFVAFVGLEETSDVGNGPTLLIFNILHCLFKLDMVE